jgi:hypothetical protein
VTAVIQWLWKRGERASEMETFVSVCSIVHTLTAESYWDEGHGSRERIGLVNPTCPPVMTVLESELQSALIWRRNERGNGSRERINRSLMRWN